MEIPGNRRPSSLWTNLPDWVIISSAYSFVIVSILLISNVTPEGKLYIYFTAFWSLLLYLFTEDSGDFYSNDILDAVVEELVVKKV